MESFLMCSFGRVFRFSKASYNALTSSFIAEQKIRWCNAKRRRQRERQKNFARSEEFFQFLCRCFAWLQHETSSELHPLIKTISHVLTKYFVSCAPFCFFFSIAAHFHLAGRQYFLSSPRRYIIFMLLFQWNSSPLFCISRSSSFSVIHENVD